MRQQDAHTSCKLLVLGWRTIHFPRSQTIHLKSKRENILRLLYRVVNSENQHLWLFWVTEMSSDDGKKVLDKYGRGGMAERIICLVPSLGSNAAFVGEISETDLDAQDVAFVQLLEKARNLTRDLTLEREQQEHWRAERAQQEKELRESERSDQREALNVIHDLSQQRERAHWRAERGQQEKELQEAETSDRGDAIEQQKEEKIRKEREQRLTEEPDSGIKIIIRTHDGKRMQRLFKDTAFFQEVYDWVGSSNNMPLYFTIQRGSTIVMHTDRLQTNEVLDISERISFLANFPNREDLSETINDNSSCKPSHTTASLKTASGECAAQIPLPCFEASSGKSTVGDSSQVQAKGKRKRKDTRTRKYKREKKKQYDNN
ncbi:DNA ligase 1-like isoform X2 [Montipora capricornis]|uniref:DNA ligase 1-like isoform X2 n=1 Tax=Montipora capricornis TaxID=246305 RepID=UPI0035F15D42